MGQKRESKQNEDGKCKGDDCPPIFNVEGPKRRRPKSPIGKRRNATSLPSMSLKTSLSGKFVKASAITEESNPDWASKRSLLWIPWIRVTMMIKMNMEIKPMAFRKGEIRSDFLKKWIRETAHERNGRRRTRMKSFGQRESMNQKG